MSFPQRSLIASALLAALTTGLVACGGGGDSWSTPAAPTGVGAEETAASAASYTSGVQPFVTYYQTNITANTTASTNAAVALLTRMNDLWVTGSTWSNGTPVNDAAAVVLDANMAKVVSMMAESTDAQKEQTYLDDRRSQSYSVIEALGPLASTWYTGAAATTSITSVPSDATTVSYTDSGNGAGDTTSALGSVVSLVNTLRGSYSSGNPSKNAYQYPRPWRQTGALSAAQGGKAAVVDTGNTVTIGSKTLPVYDSPVSLLATLKPVASTTPATDGGFVSGHTNAAYLAAIALAYAVPERFQELLTRASEVGDDRIRSGYHSPLDVMGGRMLATALGAAILGDSANATLKASARSQALSYLTAQTGATADTLYTVAHTGDSSRFADAATNRANYLRTLTYGFAQIGTAGQAAIVPQGAEVLLETRLPYLSAAQRRVVLKTTAIDSGYPVLDDTEGWGRLNLVAAADGYGAFNADVTVTMDASLGGFHAADTWSHDIGGAGLLTKQGSGSLTLSGANSYSGGTLLVGGELMGRSTSAFGTGHLYQRGGTLTVADNVALPARFTQTGGTLKVVVGSGAKGKLVSASDVTLGGALVVTFSAYTPAVGDSFTVVSGSQRHGQFSSVSVPGYASSVSYSRTGVTVKLTAVN
jgi:autotransporter-associated beta strand protein